MQSVGVIAATLTDARSGPARNRVGPLYFSDLHRLLARCTLRAPRFVV